MPAYSMTNPLAKPACSLNQSSGELDPLLWHTANLRSFKDSNYPISFAVITTAGSDIGSAVGRGHGLVGSGDQGEVIP